MKTLIYGLTYWKKYLPYAILAQIFSFVAIIADLGIPLISALFINHIILDENLEKEKGIFKFLLSGEYGDVRSFKLFFSIAIVFFSMLLVRIILVYFKNVTLNYCGLMMETDLRIVTYNKLMKLDSATVARYNSGELLQTVNSDTIMFKELYARMIPNILDSILILILCISFLSDKSLLLLIIPVIVTPIMILALRKFMRKARENYRNIRKNDSNMNLTVQENIEAVRLVRSFTNEKLEKNKFDKANDSLMKSHFSQINLSSKFDVFFSSIKQVTYIGTLAISAYLVIDGQIMVGLLMTCTTYVVRVMDHITQINNTLSQAQQMMVAGNSIDKFLKEESLVYDKEEAEDINGVPNLKIDNISLAFGDKQVLKNISLDIPYGKKVGIVGGTGSGKSILLKTLVRIHDVKKGSININNKNVKEYSLESLRATYSFVFQDIFLFSNTIDSNIAFSDPNIDKEKVLKAAREAQAHEFIEKLPQGYETIVGEKGLGLSGGQKQRVSIARALLKCAPILVLDDATSALDPNTEKKLLETIKTNYPEKTLLISAHRMSSVVDCDEIIYMQDGEIIERGNFDELMKLDGHFAKVYNIQTAERKAVIDFDTISEQDNNGEEI